MKSKLLNILAISAAVATTAISCGKDKPLTSETTEVATTREGNVYELDTLNSRVEWKGFKVIKSDNMSHFGTIKFESGEVTVKEGKLESGKFVADMNSINSIDLKGDAEQHDKLVGHLKDDDFFGVAKFPTSSFEITKVTPNQGGDYNTLIDGNLTIKGITKPVSFNANVSLNNGEVNIATEPKDIDREDFGVKFQMPVTNGVIKNEVNIQIFIKGMERK
ncbi:polyisoprenoid-binding protein [Chryseobacterium sp. 6424]|uniref:YceI family protein n=1 Tax=Chryseobacterium sp. 6424 TaxID=2039166 RepID=UPI000EFDB06F|nr:YceI family protein [Chryseobacterium sp. 6424]AYO58170.1 polyisoprenoid-binding protein [Chryseobacterium sp. 6424]